MLGQFRIPPAQKAAGLWSRCKGKEAEIIYTRAKDVQITGVRIIVRQGREEMRNNDPGRSVPDCILNFYERSEQINVRVDIHDEIFAVSEEFLKAASLDASGEFEEVIVALASLVFLPGKNFFDAADFEMGYRTRGRPRVEKEDRQSGLWVMSCN
jgi:hypothetical protein